MKEECKGCEDKQACIPFFVHENTVVHLNRINKRIMLVFSALFVIVCLTVSFIVGTLVNNNTIREKQIIDMMNKRIAEVENATEASPP